MVKIVLYYVTFTTIKKLKKRTDIIVTTLLMRKLSLRKVNNTRDTYSYT